MHWTIDPAITIAWGIQTYVLEIQIEQREDCFAEREAMGRGVEISMLMANTILV